MIRSCVCSSLHLPKSSGREYALEEEINKKGLREGIGIAPFNAEVNLGNNGERKENLATAAIGKRCLLAMISRVKRKLKDKEKQGTMIPCGTEENYPVKHGLLVTCQ